MKAKADLPMDHSGHKPDDACCSPQWCGLGCTHADYEAVRQLAEKTCRQLGPGWKPRVFENLGWHGFAEAAGVHVSPPRRAGDRYSVILNGHYTASAKTARAAVRKAFKLAELDVLALQASYEAAYGTRALAKTGLQLTAARDGGK